MSTKSSLLSIIFFLLVFAGLIYAGHVERGYWDTIFVVVFGFIFADWTVEILNTRLHSSLRVPSGVTFAIVLLAIAASSSVGGAVANFLNSSVTFEGSSFPVEIGSAAICIAVYAYTRLGFSQHLPVKRLEGSYRG